MSEVTRYISCEIQEKNVIQIVALNEGLDRRLQYNYINIQVNHQEEKKICCYHQIVESLSLPNLQAIFFLVHF